MARKRGTEQGRKAAEFFASAGKKAENAVERALVTGGLMVERDAKLNVRVDTGRLRSSITHRLVIENGKPVVYVGTSVEYAPYIEFGTGIYAEKGDGRKTPWSYQDEKGNWIRTRGSRPHPFLYPAFRQNKDRVKKLLIREILKELEKR